MGYAIDKRLKNYLNYESIKVFMRQLSLSPSGLKDEILSRIEAHIDDGGIPLTTWEEFVVDQLKNGHNRSIYRTKLNPASLLKVKSKNRLCDSLSQAGFPSEIFSTVHTIVPESDEPEMVHLHYTFIGDEVSKVEICFVYLIWTNRGLEDGEFMQVDETEYVWIEIDITKDILTISLRPRGNTSDSSGKSYQMFNKYTSFLTDVFSIRYLSNDDFKNVLYNIFNELTTRAETPYVQKVAPLVEEINEICDRYATILGLPSAKEPVNLPLRFKRLLERSLIQDDFYAFKSYSEGKIGSIEKFYYADDTGARVNVAANEGDGIELSDIYFDTRETIDDQMMFNKLWVNWFLPEGYIRKETGVRLEACSSYYLIHFFKFLDGGEKDHVLSTIEAFREL
jgi:hypothetical protein